MCFGSLALPAGSPEAPELPGDLSAERSDELRQDDNEDAGPSGGAFILDSDSILGEPQSGPVLNNRVTAQIFGFGVP